MADVSNPAGKAECLKHIFENAERDGIDLSVLPFLDEALYSISELGNLSEPSLCFEGATKIDTHTHPVPSWFRELDPMAGGRPTPEWNVIRHLHFNAERGIKRSILCVSTPQANAFPGDKAKTLALARLLNEYVAEVVRLYPDRFSWLAITALPYVEESIREVRYAIGELGAIGVGILTNHDGLYPGASEFDGLWAQLQEREEDNVVVFIHPTDSVLRLEDGQLVNANPTPFRAGLGDFYFETARAISSITASGTILRYPKLDWRISHGAGAFPDLQDRFLLGFPDIADKARAVYATRFWYDSAGPVYPRQVRGLLVHEIPESQLVFGTDYPYGMGFFNYDDNIANLENADFLSEQQKEGVLFRNSEKLWKAWLPAAEQA
ncbi:amidohydrolase 2 [Sporormia fimetaria CBS 119925]|uniref:Amidohydrolase 2 n=1 Tax=Sporormia fimetaria CBS 119925 TaxID=1340428 RepID=A0A6A6VEX5_9PLEO|nr:amidohydrolase 2 [Sporormia fimetaria CBS 119925]